MAQGLRTTLIKDHLKSLEDQIGYSDNKSTISIEGEF